MKAILPEHDNNILGSVCAKKWKDLVDTFQRKLNKNGSGSTPISDRAAQWRFYDHMIIFVKNTS